MKGAQDCQIWIGCFKTPAPCGGLLRSWGWNEEIPISNFFVVDNKRSALTFYKVGTQTKP
jgi:hypothetical protein